ncbi:MULTISPECIES: Shedu anti-phage system protein SduA domain-containing protein, partial [unclassified Sphingopyxis]
MPTLFELSKPENQARFHRELAEQFPDALYGSRRDFSAKLAGEFDAALATGSEEAMQNIIETHPYLLQYAFRTTGHHGTWAYAKRWIRTNQVNGQRGLIPDFIAAMSNSLGYSWQIIELKRPDVQFANKRGDGLSTEAHKALAQCGEYMSHFANYIENVRVNVGNERIKQPDGVTIVMGDSRLENEAQRKVRVGFQDLSPKISIATYDRLRRGLLNDVMPSALETP